MEIKLTGKKGGMALIDEENYEQINKYKWHQTPNGYARSKINKKSVYMHRFILNSPENKVVDHINHNKLDNRSENLRIITSVNNKKNQIKRKNATSKYYGVRKKNNKFYAGFYNDGIYIHIGSFNNELDAAESYDIYIIDNNINYKTLNFPNKKDKYLLRESKNIKKEKSIYWS